MFENTSKRQREHSVHLRVLRNQDENHNQTLKDATVLMDIHTLRTRCYLNPPNVHEQSISLNGECDRWIIVHYQF
jgi:hypothetical protein